MKKELSIQRAWSQREKPICFDRHIYIGFQDIKKPTWFFMI
jgi:hypothetical protein